MCQTAFSVMPSPRVLPIFVTRRKILPLSIPDACSQAPSSSITQAGMGTVRTWPAFPFRSTIAQCSSRCSRCSILRPTASFRLSPQARSSARSARSRLPFSFSQSGDCHSARLCSAVSQFPRRTPRFLTPFTRRMPAARSPAPCWAWRPGYCCPRLRRHQGSLQRRRGASRRG